MVDKTNLKEQFIRMVKTDIEKQRQSFESARQASIDAPGKMQSRYDTMGIESAWVADGLGRALREKELNLKYLETFQWTEFRICVGIGSIVKILSSDTPDPEYFFVLPVLSGYELCENDMTITTLSPETPLGKVLLGKKTGEKIPVNFPTHRTITIEELI
ncbi:MAG: hypothetical protein DWB56_00640 [Candidatus Jettenia sp.]|uniref:Transcription elongation factor GreA/GreB C-terminal domain-containing protein n=1 Tax=Candidatus Jettenia caeni TaxID=247490 RepID=I3IJ31_9BACT|nr:GreA/GreB family elongation factor [Candidatus Jettenia sp. AMX1]MBC6927459.1 hypothetical protein [Candidatus Jettenia sp.]NUN21988.1 GreA/GreB family elongation factor [Candidatus Jettenia caeni]KAA0249746.1 MAG: hypothetical protein EDM77_07505 [Candidatus Jettenia sp. AMX1]MCE7879142.1 hypothetical protein [Candidatus Jettenia sp. AMX1]MCQ3925739.1 hypothetical protein [Candidatus Jettenia sp.]